MATKVLKQPKDLFENYNPKDYILIKVVPEKMEVINYKLGIIGDPVTWLVPFVEF